MSENTKVLLTITESAGKYRFLFDLQYLIDVINEVNVKHGKKGVCKEDYDDMVYHLKEGITYFKELDKEYMTDILNALLEKNKSLYLFDVENIIKENY